MLVSPSRRSTLPAARATTRVTIESTARKVTRMNVATAVAGMFALIHATLSSNAAVNREPGCAQPTLATTTPWSGQLTRNIVVTR